MGRTPANGGEDLNRPVKSDEERTLQANEVCGRACEESGVKVSSWRHFAAWKEYVDGTIGESQLAEKAKTEMEEFSKSFGKYLIVASKDDSASSSEEEEKKNRAKRANKIYRKVCSEAGMKVYFFHDLASWIDFVEGKISESEFYERAKLEIGKMKGESN